MQNQTAKLFIEMEPRQLTTLGQLKEGDRFCFKSDRYRLAWQVMPQPEKKKTWKHGGHTWAADIEVKNDLGQVKYCLRKTEVIFLRHTQPQTL